MKQLLYILILLSVSAVATAEESNPIYGNSSTRGVTRFDVPGKASIGYSDISSFSRYSTGVNRLRQPRALYSGNPLSYNNKASNQMPKSGYGSFRKRSGMVNARMNSLKVRSKLGSYNSRSNMSLSTSNDQQNPGTSTRYAGYNYDRFPLRIKRTSNQALKQLISGNSTMLTDRYKRLLQGNRRGRLSYSKVSMNRSILNKKTRVNGGSILSTTKYSTSSILSNR